MPWYFYALSSALFFAIQELLMRVLAIRSNVPRVFSVVFNGWGVLFALIAFIIQGGSFAEMARLTPINILLIISSGVLYGLYERYQFIARKGINASSLSIIFRLSTVIAFVSSIILLHEPLTLYKTLGTVLIIGASYLLIYKNPHLTFTPAVGYALLCSVLMGMAMTIDKPASAHLQPSLYSFLTWCFSIVIIVFPGIKRQQILKEFHIGGWKVAVAAFLNVVAYILYLQAFALADASKVVPIIAINAILVVLGGIFILGEHDHIWRKIIAAALAFTGVILLK